MKYISDLHTNSAASDGQYIPVQLVHMARERRMDILALTDHDTLDGLNEAAWAGKECGL